MQNTLENKTSWLDRSLLDKSVISVEILLFVLILILAVVSRFYNLEARVMSHDENSHVYYSWRLFRGQGFAHDPLMHGPLQFHMLALSYFVFGDGDFTARIPAALFSIATVAFMWNYRRYLGRIGALVAAVLMLISPYMLYYGRYVRNEAYVAFLGVVTIWAILRYLESGKARYLYWLTAVTALHFTAKETSFIYTAQALIFLLFYFVYQIYRKPWKDSKSRNLFLVTLTLGLLLIFVAGALLLNGEGLNLNATEVVSPAAPTQEIEQLEPNVSLTLPITLAILGGLSMILSMLFLIRGYTISNIKKERSFDMLILLGTLVLPQLSAFPARLMGWNIPTNASEVQAFATVDILHMAFFFIPFVVVSVLIGLWWNSRRWLINAAIFYGIFTVLYTTVFTNGAGFFTGMVGSLGYWLEQQGVNRGSQPLYYYWLVQIPIYEYLPALGTVLLIGMAVLKRLVSPTKHEDAALQAENNEKNSVSQDNKIDKAPAFAFLIFWALTSLVAYTFAGEKMPWLTVHIAWPLILCAGWFFGRLIEAIDWNGFRKSQGWLVIAILAIFLLSFLAALGSLLGTNPPFQGKELEQLSATSTFMVSFLTAIASGIGLIYFLKSWSFTQIVLVVALISFTFLGILTARTAIQATYINYDNANELLVYAHSAGGVKIALEQIEEISQRTTDGLALSVAYDNETSYPYWWYLRNYNNSRYYGADPTRSLREVPVILVGDANYGKIEPVVGQAYNRFDYIRLWWPNQDYFNLTWDRIINALRDPSMRAALFQIWFNRDYSLYGEVTNKDMDLTNWSPSASMRLYIRKDVVNQLWNYGAAPSLEPIQADPYEGNEVKLTANRTFGSQGDQASQFQRPRGVAVAGDGSIYVADTENNRIQHLTPDGKILHVWGKFGDTTTGNAPGGTFNQPWGLDVGPDGSVFVADTWNHRIQKFSSEGKFLKMWGYFGQAEGPNALWGPRDVAVDQEGNVFVTDTGNKRVVVFDLDGNHITQFGGAGMAPGQFDEPVGIAVDKTGNVYVVDTWNQRIQVFSRFEDSTYIPETEWEVVAWFGQSLDNKPYIDVNEEGMVFTTDPEGYRVLQFTQEGDFVQFWGDFGTELDSFGIPVGIGVDLNGDVWVSDAGNNRIMHFSLETPP